MYLIQRDKYSENSLYQFLWGIFGQESQDFKQTINPSVTRGVKQSFACVRLQRDYCISIVLSRGSIFDVSN